jgi:hypothetical protein
MKNEITLTDRSEINEIFKRHLGMKVSLTDDQWKQVEDSIHNDDELWGYVYDSINKAVSDLTEPLIKTL